MNEEIKGLTVEKKDIFDRIMSWKILRPLYPIYHQYKEPLLYLFFGVLCTIVNIFSFWIFTKAFPPLVANVIAWIISVAFAYFTNRTWVFGSQSTSKGSAAVLQEAGRFVGGRVGTLVMEEAILWIGIEMLSLNNMAVKIAAQVAVVIGNYVISKCIVFKG